MVAPPRYIKEMFCELVVLAVRVTVEAEEVSAVCFQALCTSDLSLKM